MQKLALIKLGGSVVTFKDKPLAANAGAIDGISRVLAQLNVPAIIVHGGGSFGHYWSMKYGMHTKPASYDVHGVSVVHESMIALNQIIVSSMRMAGLNPYGMPPSVFATNRMPIVAKIRQVYAMAKSKVMPVTFGDVVHVESTKYSILSGDALMTILAKVLRPSKVSFRVPVGVAEKAWRRARMSRRKCASPSSQLNRLACRSTASPPIPCAVASSSAPLAVRV